MVRLAWMARIESVLTTMPLATGVEQDEARLRRPSTSTTQTLQEAMLFIEYIFYPLTTKLL